MEYEVVYEIFNECSNNQMRDIFFEELEFSREEDMETFVRNKHNGRIGNIDKTILPQGGIQYDFVIGDVKQRYTFSLIG